MKIGVVCEGSNDFLALKEIVFEIATEKDVIIDAFDALQPQVDATSANQVGEGGWYRVKVWLEENSGESLVDVLNPGLFSTSSTYDALIIHLDGDVIEVSGEFLPVTRAQCFQRPDLVVTVVENFIEQTLRPPDALDDSIIYAVPVQHTEAWLVAASIERPLSRNIEYRSIKKVAHRFLKKRYKDDLKQASQQAARNLGQNLDTIRQSLSSVEHFAAKIDHLFT